jgi:hypothetical protein
MRSDELERQLRQRLDPLGPAPRAESKCFHVMAGALRQAVAWQLLSVSPAAGVSPPRVERAELRIPTAAEMRALVDAAAETSMGSR